jgi:hypothetical protein
MIYLALLILVVTLLYYQKLIRDGKIPRPNEPHGLPTRVFGLTLLAVSICVFFSINFRGGFNQSSLLPTLTGIGVGVLALIRAKRTQEMERIGGDNKDEMKRSVIFLGFAILAAVILAILYPYMHR